jgi:hypothetical protein
MQRKIAFGIPFSILLFILVSGLVASAQTVAIVYTDRGWYSSDGFHDPSNTNYIAGDFTDPTGSHEHRNFFVFDLSSIAKPIASATLTLLDPLYVSDDPSENYELHDVVTPIPSLIAGTGGLAAFNDLGSGVVYGSRTMTAADKGTVVNIPLNSSAIDAMNNATGPFAMGGSITTLDSITSDEFAFGFSDILSVDFGGALQLTLAPEPTSAALIAFAAMIFGVQRSRKRSI